MDYNFKLYFSVQISAIVDFTKIFYACADHLENQPEKYTLHMSAAHVPLITALLYGYVTYARYAYDYHSFSVVENTCRP